MPVGSSSKLLGAVIASAAAQMLLQTPAQADTKPAAPAKKAAHCVHNCAGYATCKGQGNNSCKGKNECAGQGQVPKECSSQTTPEACKAVQDAKKNGMCSWFTE